MAYYRRRRRFGGTSRPRVGVTQSSLVTKKRGKCRACSGHFEAGETIAVLRLKKHYRVACGGCGHRPVGTKKFHAHCVPADINAAMGFDPAKVQSHQQHHAHSAAPPPPPPSSKDAMIAAIAALEHALVLKLRDNPSRLTPEVENDFRKIQGLKARVLRPGTEGEGEVATSITLQKLVKVAFA